jgi:hypothetical protein
MTNDSFLPGLPALCGDPVRDDAGEDEGHPEDDDQMGEVLPEREGTDQLVMARVEDAVREEIEEQSRGDCGPADLGEGRDR